MVKPPRLANGRRPHCCYCKRQLDPPVPERPTSLTFDHILAESEGGRYKVPCCLRCNNLKDNLDPQDWFLFIDSTPGWWRTFTNPRQVREAVRELKVAQVRAKTEEARQRDIESGWAIQRRAAGR